MSPPHFVTLPAPDPDRAAAVLLRAVQAREGELQAWVIPLVTSYLPPGDPTEGAGSVDTAAAGLLPSRIALCLCRDALYEVHEQTVVIPLLHPAWHGEPDLVWAGLVRTLYLAGLSNWRANNSAEAAATDDAPPTTATALAAAVTEAVLEEGMATYVAMHGQAFTSSGANLMELQRRREVSQRFLAVRAQLSKLHHDYTPKDVWFGLEEAEAEASVFAVAGSFMARRIEERFGRRRLVAAVAAGGLAFYDAYQSTEPGAMLSFGLPLAPPTAKDPLTH